MLHDFGLTKDPFTIAPDGPVENWAGRAELKEDLIDLMLGVRANDIGSTEFLVLYGELGAGKSHALRYLKTRIENDVGDFRSLCVYLERPRVSAKLNFLELYKYIIAEIGQEQIGKIFGRVESDISKETRRLAEEAGYGEEDDKSTFERRAISLARANDQKMLQLLKRGASDESNVYKYLLGGAVCNGPEYDGKIDSDFMASKVLADFLRTITSTIGSERPIYESVYIFVDECEILFDAKPTESDPVFSGFRELINGVPYGLGLILSFSAATALIEAYMPQHLLKRMTHDFIEVPMLEDDQAVEFLKEQMSAYRPEDSEYMDTLYPFSREAIEFLVENQTTLTPRNLFMACRRVLERSVRRFGLHPGDEISVELAEQIVHPR